MVNISDVADSLTTVVELWAIVQFIKGYMPGNNGLLPGTVFCQRIIQRVRDRCLREWWEFRALPLIPQLGLGIYAVFATLAFLLFPFGGSDSDAVFIPFTVACLAMLGVVVYICARLTGRATRRAWEHIRP